MDKNVTSLQVMIAILVILIIAAFGLIFGILFPTVANSGFKALNIPRIVTSVNADDGSSHIVSADVTLESDKARELDSKDVQGWIADLVKHMNYDKLAAYGGTDYFKQEIKDNLSKELGVDVNIYLTNLASDLELPQSTQEDTDEQRGSIFRALFPNAK